MTRDGPVGTGAVLPSPLTQTVLWCLAAAVTVGVLIADATPLRFCSPVTVAGAGAARL